MSTSHEPQYLLLWKGCQSGPFSLAVIHERLSSGEISRMHQVNVSGKWIILAELLEKHAQVDQDARRRAEAEKREEQLRRDFDEQLASERAHQSVLEERLAEAEIRPSLSSPIPPPQPQYFPLPEQRFHTYPVAANTSSRTSGLAIAALVMGLCNFVPFLNLVTWILALVFGHVALSQMSSDPTLKGRGMAVAGLAITYFLLMIGIVFGILMAVNNQHLF